MHPGTPEQGRDFFERFWPEARAVSDPEGSLYAAFGIKRGGVSAFLRPAVWTAGLRAVAKGNGVGRPKGDPFMMSGVFVVEDGRITRSHLYRHAGDHPEWARLLSRTAPEATP